jgi:hypothetical protein
VSDSPAPPKPKEDVVLVHGVSETGDALRVIRKREDRIEVGEMRVPVEGRPLQGDLVRLKQRAEGAPIFDVEVLVSKDDVARPRASVAHPDARPRAGVDDDDAGPKRAGTGPANVATEAYREGWEAIFGKKRGQLPN